MFSNLVHQHTEPRSNSVLSLLDRTYSTAGMPFRVWQAHRPPNKQNSQDVTENDIDTTMFFKIRKLMLMSVEGLQQVVVTSRSVCLKSSLPTLSQGRPKEAHHGKKKLTTTCCLSQLFCVTHSWHYWHNQKGPRSLFSTVHNLTFPPVIRYWNVSCMHSVGLINEQAG